MLFFTLTTRCANIGLYILSIYSVLNCAACSLCHSSLVLQYITYGLLFGCGSSFTLQPSLVILGQYFHRRLGLANGLVTAGSSLFSVGMPALMEEVVAPLGLSKTFQILSALPLVQVALVSLTFRPRLMPSNSDNEASTTTVGRPCQRFLSQAKQFICTGVFHVSTYRVWAFGVATAVLGYFVPYVHLVRPHFIVSSFLV